MQKNKQLHIKNHFVPEFYLKRWEDKNKNIWVYSILVEHANVPLWKPKKRKAIAYQKHLYTQFILDNESDGLETWFAKKWESPANSVIDKAITEKRLTLKDWDILIRFLAAQDVRTPSRLIEHIKKGNEYLPKVLNQVLSDLEKKLASNDLTKIENPIETADSKSFPLNVKTYHEEGEKFGILKTETYVGRSTWIFSIKRLLNVTRKILHSHKWTIIKPAKGFYWPTSDNPVVKLNYYGPNNYDLKGGWGKEKGNIIFPISPEHAMFVQIGEKPMQKNIRLSINQTLQIRKIITENAFRKVFSYGKDSDIPTFCKRTIDPQSLNEEKELLNKWHEENLKMERNYPVTNTYN